MSGQIDTRGVGYTKHLDETLRKGVYQTPIPNMQFLYEVSATKSPDWYLGDKVVTPDGRKFRYCLSSGRCDTFIGNQFGVEIPAAGIDYSSPAEDAPVGQDWIKMTNQGVVAQTLDGLRGGRINMSPIEGVPGNPFVQQRNVVGNTAGGASEVITVYFDAPLVTIVTAATGKAWCMPSQYSAVASAQLVGAGVSGRRSFVGYAAAPVSGTGLYHWEQTWGEISASLYGSAVGKTQYRREVVFRFDGNLIHRGAAGVTGLEAQTAGFIMDSNVQNNGATVIYLKIID